MLVEGHVLRFSPFPSRYRSGASLCLVWESAGWHVSMTWSPVAEGWVGVARTTQRWALQQQEEGRQLGPSPGELATHEEP